MKYSTRSLIRPLRLVALTSAAAVVLSGSFPAVVAAPAFPGAVGFGANATGGRAGTVYRVTTLANSGPGTFRDAVSQPNRVIIFDVGGYITLSSELALNDNLTIAGQTAPGGGIAFRGAEVSSGSSSNLIIRHVRFRPGSGAASGAHCLNLYGATNVILDHVSLEFGPWNNVGGVNSHNITIQDSLIADPIGQRFGAHMERLGGTCAWYRNIFANGHNRQPLSKINTVFINNVVYNYEAGYTCGDTSGSFLHDIIGNYFITGPATDTAANDFYQIGGNQSIYESGNLRDSNLDGALNGSTTLVGEGTPLGSPWWSSTPGIPTVSAPAAFRQNLSLAGAWPRDQVDNVILNEVRSVGTAGPNPLPSSQTVTGLGNNGFGTINGGTTALDTDQDGMPDFWEVATGLNPALNDSMTIGPDGYANIERYLNWLAAPHAFTVTNSAVDVDLWPYTAGYTNASPVYWTGNATNGSALLTNGHVARFTPTAGFSGFGVFQFGVGSADGLGLTNTVVVLVSSLPPPSNLIWRGDGAANVWAMGSGTNWFDGEELVTFTSGDNATFDDTGSNAPAISIIGAVSAGSVWVLAEQDYTFGGSGSLGGPTALFKVGAGKLTINTLNTFTGGTTINEGVVQLGDGVSANGSLGGTLTNNDTLIFANPTAVTSAASISGSGVVLKRGSGTLTLSGAHTYTNLTTIEEGTLEFSGTPPAGNITNNTVLTFRPPSAMTYAGIISGPGRVQTSASSITTTLSGANTFTGGINITSGNLQLAHHQAAGTGPVTNSSSGLVYVANGVVITNDFTLTTSTTDLSMRCDSGTATWAGNVTNLGSGASWRPGSDGGTLVFTGNALQGTRNFIVPRGTFHMASNAVISATGSATALGRDTTDGNRSANIYIKDNAIVTLGVCSMGGGRAGGYVTVTVQNNARLSTDANNFDLHNVNRSSAVTTLRLNGGKMTVGGFTKTRAYTNMLQFNGGLLRAGANNASFLPAFTGQNAYVMSGGARINSGYYAITIAQPLVHDPALGGTPDGGLTKTGAGTLTLSGASTFTGPTRIQTGTLVLSGSGSMAGASSIYIAAGALLDASGTSSGRLLLLGGGRTLLGDGSLKGGLLLGSGAVLSPGSNSLGQLTFSNDVTFMAGSTNVIELMRGPVNDLVKVLGTASLGGTLVVSNVGLPLLQAGDSFKVIDAAAYANNFSEVRLPALAAGLAWDRTRLETEGVITVVTVTPPVFAGAYRSGADLVFSGSNGVPGASYLVLTSTNLGAPYGEWDCVATNLFDTGGAFVFTNLWDAATPEMFYLLQVP